MRSVVVAKNATVVAHAHSVALDAVYVQVNVRRDVPGIHVPQAGSVRVEVGQQLVRERAAVIQEVALVGHLIHRGFGWHDGDTVRWRIREIPAVACGMRTECVMDIDIIRVAVWPPKDDGSRSECL